MPFLSFFQGHLLKRSSIATLVWHSFSEMVTYGEPMLTLLQRHRDIRILKYSENHCCPATKRRTIDTSHNRQPQLVNNPGLGLI